MPHSRPSFDAADSAATWSGHYMVH